MKLLLLPVLFSVVALAARAAEGDAEENKPAMLYKKYCGDSPQVPADTQFACCEYVFKDYDFMVIFRTTPGTVIENPDNRKQYLMLLSKPNEYAKITANALSIYGLASKEKGCIVIAGDAQGGVQKVCNGKPRIKF